MLFVNAFVRWPGFVLFAIYIGFALGTAGIVHLRMLNDWRAQYTMNLHDFEKRNAVGRNIRVGK